MKYFKQPATVLDHDHDEADLNHGKDDLDNGKIKMIRPI